MEGANLLAKLTAHGLAITGEGFGGFGGVTESDVAGALAGFRPEVAYQYMRLKYSDDRSMLYDVAGHIAAELLKEIKDDPPSGEYDVLTIALSVVDQATDDLNCRTCGGTTLYRYKDCKACAGTGKKALSDRYCASIAGLPRKAYKRFWERKIKAHIARLQEYDSRGLVYVRNRLRDRSEADEKW